MKPGVDYAPAQDRKGNELKPGDKVSFKTYPKGTAKGVVAISPRAKEKYDGKWLPALIIKANDTTYPLNSKGVRKLKEDIMRDLIQQLRESRSLRASDVSRLPVGSLVYATRDRSYWVVNQGGVVLPITVLPERSTGHFPDDGDPPSSVGDEFELISKGKGKLPTKGTAKKAAMKR